MSKLPYRIPRSRGQNSIVADPQRLESADKQRWACGRNVKRALPDHRYDSVEVWTLKERVSGKAVTVRSQCSREEAVEWVKSKMTLREAQKLGREVGAVIKRTHFGDEFSVMLKEGNEASTYYCDDLEDAVRTARAMRDEYDRQLAKVFFGGRR